MSLPTLNINIPIVDQDGNPSTQFQRFFQNLSKAIDAEIGAAIAAAAALAAAATANAAAATATAAAASAGTAASTANAATQIANSYVTGATLTATDAGASASIAISAHTRVFGDGTSVAVNSGNLTGLAYTTKFYLFYDDPARTGGAVTYQSSTSATVAAQAGNRFVVGSVTTPAALGAPATGRGVQPPGASQL